jgi:hypothetical protein
VAKTVSEAQLERLERKLDQLCEWINGNSRQPGLKVRIDRLERHVVGFKWLFATAITLLLGNLLTVWLRG